MSSSVVSDDNISLKCTDDERKVNFLNPVLVNPWHSVMPMGYSETFNESLLNLTKQKKQVSQFCLLLSKINKYLHKKHGLSNKLEHVFFLVQIFVYNFFI